MVLWTHLLPGVKKKQDRVRINPGYPGILCSYPGISGALVGPACAASSACRSGSSPGLRRPLAWLTPDVLYLPGGVGYVLQYH